MQINVGHLNEEGVYTGQFTTFALAGNVRGMVSRRPGAPARRHPTAEPQGSCSSVSWAGSGLLAQRQRAAMGGPLPAASSAHTHARSAGPPGEPRPVKTGSGGVATAVQPVRGRFRQHGLAVRTATSAAAAPPTCCRARVTPPLTCCGRRSRQRPTASSERPCAQRTACNHHDVTPVASGGSGSRGLHTARRHASAHSRAA